MSKRVALGALCGWFALVSFGCSQDFMGAGGPVVVPLSYEPEHAKDVIFMQSPRASKARLYVGEIRDERDQKASIGENRENATPIAIHSDSDPAQFFRQTLITQLQQAGYHVVSDPSQADRVISGELTRFWVIETNNYEAEVTAALKVSDPAGVTKWEGTESGRGQNFGRSLNAENYRQTLSDAMVRLTYENLLPNTGFQEAVGGAMRQ